MNGVPRSLVQLSRIGLVAVLAVTFWKPLPDNIGHAQAVDSEGLDGEGLLVEFAEAVGLDNFAARQAEVPVETVMQ